MYPTDALAGVLVAIVLVAFVFVAFAVLSVRIVPPGERLVVYRLGKTSAVLVRGHAGRTAWYLVLIIPLIDRVVRIEGDLVEPWDSLRDALPADWIIRRPAEDDIRAPWLVRAQGPAGDEVEAGGHTQREALVELTRQLAKREASLRG